MFKLSLLVVVTAWFSFTSFGFSSEQMYETPKDSINKKSEKRVSFYDTSSIFTEDWKVNVTFSYSTQSIDRTRLIQLIDTIRGYAFPLEKETTSGFGRRHGSYHKGVDIPLVNGEKIVAAFDGKVRYATYNSGGFGNLVIIRHTNGLETYYAHLSKIKVKPNQIVKAGQVIGHGGSTGRSYSPHLHFEVRYQDVAFDPARIFDLDRYCLRSESALLGELLMPGTYTPTTIDNHDHDYEIQLLAKYKTYSVRSGDTLSKIAARYGTTVDELCDLNGLSRTATLQIGQQIKVN